MQVGISSPYSRADCRGAIIVLDADNEERAQEYLDSLPFAKRGIQSFEVYGAKPYRGFLRGI